MEDGRIVRHVKPAAVGVLETFLRSDLAARLIAEGRLISSRRVEDPGSPDQAVCFEHDPVWFPSYPHEWPPAMLRAAASLTVDLAEALLDLGLGLKDATPFNILFRGPQPVLVDVLSIEHHDPCDPVWLAEAQFERTFLLPLLAARAFKISLNLVFLSSRDGLEPEQLFAWSSIARKLAPGFFGSVTLPTLLGRSRKARGAALYRPIRLRDPRKAEFVLRMTYRRLRRRLRRLKFDSEQSRWTSYADENSYGSSDGEKKLTFVRETLGAAKPAFVLDIGCNTGVHAELAARGGASVVAIDRDSAAVGRLWGAAVREQLEILPLVVDLARPTPATGWCNAEERSFLDRARGAFDAVMMLAVIHHLVITDRIPLAIIADLAAQLTRSLLLVEYVGPGDPMFQILVRGREALFTGYDRASFESAFHRHFRSTAVTQTGRDRHLYAMQRLTPQ